MQLAFAILAANSSRALLQVGSSKLHYSFTQKSPYYFNLVVANGAVPIQSVSVRVDGSWVDLPRSTNNVYPYYNSDGFYSFPMEIRVTPVCGPTVSPSLQ